MKESSKHFWAQAPVPRSHTAAVSELSLSRGARKFLAVSFAVTGVICVVFTGKVYDALPYIIGIMMCALGVTDFLRGLFTKEFKRRETKLTANGIVFLLLGIVVLWKRANADNLIGAIWGTIGLLKGSEELNEAIYSCAHKERFVGKTVRALIELALGFLLLIDPVSNMHHHLTILGLELITAGLETWWETDADDET